MIQNEMAQNNLKQFYIKIITNTYILLKKHHSNDPKRINTLTKFFFRLRVYTSRNSHVSFSYVIPLTEAIYARLTYILLSRMQTVLS